MNNFWILKRLPRIRRRRSKAIRAGESRPDQSAQGLLESAAEALVRRDHLPLAKGGSAIWGRLIVNTGKHTARAAQDKFIVREATTEEHIWWGEYNRPISADEVQRGLQPDAGLPAGARLFVQDCYAGADPEYRLPVRIITEYAWHSLFARNMFIQPQEQRGIPPAHPGIHRDLRPVVQGV